MGDAYYYTKTEVEYAIKNPAIIHYLGEERPWRKGNKHKFKIQYEKYLSMTPWSNDKPEEGWETYFKLWNVFNIVMTPFPKLRYHIPLLFLYNNKHRTLIVSMSYMDKTNKYYKNYILD